MTDCYQCDIGGKEACRSDLRAQCLKFWQTPNGARMIYPLYAVYALFDLRGYLVYVGKSINVTSRIQQHWHDDNKRFWHWDYFGCETASEQRDVEAALIQRFRPKYNKVIPPLNEMGDDSQIVHAINWLNYYVRAGEAWRIKHADYLHRLDEYLYKSQDQIA